MSDFLPFRNAFADIAGMETEELFTGTACAPPLLSIVIPTYRRPGLLVEAVRSALEQDCRQSFEIVVVDDDPASTALQSLLTAVPALGGVNFRYLRNSQNIGMYGNINRCVEQARGEWVTILHDDDLLDPCWAREMFALLAAGPAIDGLICQKRGKDRRDVPFTEGPLKGILRRGLELYRFWGRPARRLRARELFWGCNIGNSVGFICRVDDIRAVGGFQPEEHPSCDYFFYARYAERFHFAEARQVLATIQIADNSLLRPETQLASLRCGYDLQCAYAGTVLPRFWRFITPLLMARQVANTEKVWRSNLRPQVDQVLGFHVPRDRPLLLFAARALLRGF